MKKIVNISLKHAVIAVTINLSKTVLKPYEKESALFKKGSFNKKFIRGKVK